MVRYHFIGWRIKRKSPKGIFIRQLCIKMSTPEQRRVATYHADKKFERVTATKIIKLDKLVSGQKRLAVWRMVYQLRNFSLMQRRKKYVHRPLVIPVGGGRYYIWDGNHRVTAGFMLGKTHMRCEVLRRSRS